MTSTLVLGSTGLVGSHIFSILRHAPPSQVSGIEVVARRSPPPAPNASVNAAEFINADLTAWAAHVESLSPPPSVLFSALAATRATAGGFDKQYQIDHDKNVELAQAARKVGTQTYVLISTGGANPKSSMGYLRMKGEIEEHIKEIGFEHTVILRPGLIIGSRAKCRPEEAVFQMVANGLGKINSRWLKDTWAVDADVIAKAAVTAGLKAARGEVKDKVWVVDQQEIITLGRVEWKDLSA